MTTELAGASVWEAQLYDHLVSHEESERGLLLEYQEAAQSSHSRAFAYLVSLIVEDEIRHHRLFQELAMALKTDVELRKDDQAGVPRLDGWGPDPGRVLELSEKLIDHERRDQALLRGLQKELDEVSDTTLWALLVRLMAADTAKHIETLEFVRHHARKSRR
jgi:hypothetical protein